MKKVFLVSNYPAVQYSNMMEEAGWEIVKKPMLADLLLFIGGADVSPALYNEPQLSCTHTDPDRDKVEQMLFDEFNVRVPMAGICRGAQFLHVMCGGKLWQDVTNHAKASGHMALDLTTDSELSVTSTHHQMMCHNCGDLLMTGLVDSCEIKLPDRSLVKAKTQVEAILHPQEHVLCYQPHPEMASVGSECRKTFLRYLEYIL